MLAEWITCHGWGYGAEIFQPWHEVLPEGVLLRHCDRGYFGEPNTVHFHEGEHLRVLWLHSFGLHWCPKELFSAARHVVILSGFARFHPENRRQSRISCRSLELMEPQLASDPTTLLNRFHDRVFSPEPSPPLDREPINQELLQRDLKRLGSVEFDPNLLNPVPEVSLVFGTVDRILQPDCREELRERLPRVTFELTLDGEGHAAGLNRPDSLFHYLNQTIEGTGLWNER